VQRLFLKPIFDLIGITFGLVCLLLANHGAIRLYGWSQTGRFAPPRYPELDKFDVITFATDPLRAFFEIGGSAFMVAISLHGLIIVFLIFWRGLSWLSTLPYLLPLTFVLMFSATIASVFTGHIDWLLPASMLLGSVAIVTDSISLRRMGLPLTARLSDAHAASLKTGPAHPQRSAWVGFAVAALLVLLAIMKIVDVLRS
jgi:hypothetical protein